MKVVVYHTIPTSNHNLSLTAAYFTTLYIILFLHQTTTGKSIYPRRAELYIILFLHQTTTTSIFLKIHTSCISYYSYIKPQPCSKNRRKPFCCISYYSYIKPQLLTRIDFVKNVVYHTIPTSNHNLLMFLLIISMLYIILFLHQTTTDVLGYSLTKGCISYYSYIKPQQWCKDTSPSSVVYHTIPTSNHNYHYIFKLLSMLYIILFLHQTTTQTQSENMTPVLYIILFLHQTTTRFKRSTCRYPLYIILFLHQTTTSHRN